MNVRGRKAHRVIMRYYFVASDSQVSNYDCYIDGSVRHFSASLPCLLSTDPLPTFQLHAQGCEESAEEAPLAVIWDPSQGAANPLGYIFPVI
jgi:hypothetical protein